MNRLVIPGILTGSVEDLSSKIKKAARFAKRISIDVIDGKLADNKTVMPESFELLDWGQLDVDVQLMIENPTVYVSLLASLGVDRVFGHVEGNGNTDEFLKACEKYGMVSGLGFDLRTPLRDWWESIQMVEAVLLMTVPIGHSGQAFHEESLGRVRWLREQGFAGDVVLDGGMRMETILLGLKAGANQFSVTSNIWEAVDPDLRYQELSGLLES